MLRLLATRIGSVFRDGFRIWILAPIIPALIGLPEFAQHVVEIQIGMFDSREAGQALANDPTRWACRLCQARRTTSRNSSHGQVLGGCQKRRFVVELAFDRMEKPSDCSRIDCADRPARRFFRRQDRR